MERITSSASKIVLIMVFLTACAGFLIGKLNATEFVPVVTLVGGYYFGNANKRSDDINTSTEEKKTDTFNG